MYGLCVMCVMCVCHVYVCASERVTVVLKEKVVESERGWVKGKKEKSERKKEKISLLSPPPFPPSSFLQLLFPIRVHSIRLI